MELFRFRGNSFHKQLTVTLWGQTAVYVSKITGCLDITMTNFFVLSDICLHFEPLTVPSMFSGTFAWSNRAPFGVVMSVSGRLL